MKVKVIGILVVAMAILTGCSDQELQVQIKKEKANADAIMAEAAAMSMGTWVPNHYQVLQENYNTGVAYLDKQDYKKAKKELDRFYAYYPIAKEDTVQAQKQAGLKTADRDALAAQANRLQKQLDQQRAQYTASEGKNRRLEIKIAALEFEIASQNQALKAAEPVAPKTYVVQPGETLNSIAAQPTVYNDPKKWNFLYENNRGTIDGDMTIYPGQVLQIVPEN
jgi:nucleoid-associated protein YgaU